MGGSNYGMVLLCAETALLLSYPAPPCDTLRIPLCIIWTHAPHTFTARAPAEGHRSEDCAFDWITTIAECCCTISGKRCSISLSRSPPTCRSRAHNAPP